MYSILIPYPLCILTYFSNNSNMNHQQMRTQTREIRYYDWFVGSHVRHTKYFSEKWINAIRYIEYKSARKNVVLSTSKENCKAFSLVSQDEQRCFFWIFSIGVHDTHVPKMDKNTNVTKATFMFFRLSTAKLLMKMERVLFIHLAFVQAHPKEFLKC